MKFKSKVKTTLDGDVERIFDPIRKKWLLSTPEELVRQSIIQYLIEIILIPISYLHVESYYSNTEGSRRFDIIAWKKKSIEFKPWLLVECKAPQVSFNRSTENQIQNYLNLYPSKFVMLSNGKRTHFWKKNLNNYRSITSLPTYSKDLN